MQTFLRTLFLTLLLGAVSCGNYSLIERIGPDPDSSYFCMTPGRYWVYLGTYQKIHEDPLTIRLTNIVAESQYFTNTPHLVITNPGSPDNGFTAIKSETYGYSQVVNILAEIPAETWGSTASPALVTIPYLTMPFIEGRTTHDTLTQTITNFPLAASSIPAVVRVTYDIRYQVFRNNLTMEVEGIEYTRCVKLGYVLNVTITSSGDNDPYSDGDTIQSYEDDYLFHLAPGVGIIRLRHSRRELGQNNIYSEAFFEGGLVSTGYLF